MTYESSCRIVDQHHMYAQPALIPSVVHLSFCTNAEFALHIGTSATITISYELPEHSRRLAPLVMQ